MRLLAALSPGFVCLLSIIDKVARSAALTLAFIRHDVLLENVLN
jgi:hypothetical protein